jgi:mannose-6-phosphate isomerase
MLRFVPQYALAPWGGRRLEHEFGRNLPDGPVAEAWELVDLEDRQSVVAEGQHAGEPLGDLWRGGILGGTAVGEFPFLLKWLNTEDRLSVQVHPDEEACADLGQGRPKSEAWYVAHSEPGAILLVGHYPGLDQATLRQAALGGTIHKWLYELAPRVGDMYLNPPGMLHAIGSGFLLLEVQQPSDTTFRLYDWDRIGLDGKPRELHLDEGLRSVAYARHGPPKAERQQVVGPSFTMRSIRAGTELPPGTLRVLVAHASGCHLASETGDCIVDYGDVVVAEAGESVRLTSGFAMVLGEP